MQCKNPPESISLSGGFFARLLQNCFQSFRQMRVPEGPVVHTGPFLIAEVRALLLQEAAEILVHAVEDVLGSQGQGDQTAPVEDGELGVNHSKSCVRLVPENAEWIRKNIPSGTKVVVYN